MYFVFLLLDPFDDTVQPTSTTDCVFRAHPDQASFELGRYDGPVSEIKVTGFSKEASAEQIFVIEGKAKYIVDGIGRSAKASGLVAVSPSTSRYSVTLDIEDSAFGRSGLHLATINAKGRLVDESETAYAWVHEPFKFAHPMTINCTIAPYEPENAWRSWLPF